MSTDAPSLVSDSVAAFRLGRALAIAKLGGTATQKWSVTTEAGRFVVRVRPVEFGGTGAVAFDHTTLMRLAAAGLPVPCPQRLSDGTSILWRENRAIEVLSWIDGEAFSAGNRNAAHELGIFLGQFHAELADNFPSGKEAALREDHPDNVEPLLPALLAATTDPTARHRLATLGEQLQNIRQEFETRLYPVLPRTVIHGDIHPGNVRFRHDRVSALYDFDYLSVQARVRDVIDALAFFASARSEPLDPDRIRSLTQPFIPQLELSCAVLSGYQSMQPLTDDEWRALPFLLHSRWLQIRLRGSRKVPPEEKPAFVLNRFSEVTDWLDRSSRIFFEKLREKTS